MKKNKVIKLQLTLETRVSPELLKNAISNKAVRSLLGRVFLDAAKVAVEDPSLLKILKTKKELIKS